MLILADLKLEREQSKRIYTNISNTVVENRVFLVFECFMRAPPMRSFSKNRKRTKIMKKSLEFSKLFFQTFPEINTALQTKHMQPQQSCMSMLLQ